MSTKAIVIAIVGTGCTVAAGTGAFLAQRLNNTSAQASQLEMVAPPTAPLPTPFSEVAVAPAPVPVERPADAIATRVSKPVPQIPRTTRRAESTPRAPVTTSGDRSATVEAPQPAEGASTAPAEAASAVDRPIGSIVENRTNRKELVEVVLADGAVIGIRLETALSSETAQLEDRVTAVVTRDVAVNERTAIPAGSRLEGVVVAAERGGRFRDRARLGVQFTSLRLPDGTNVKIRTEPIYRDGESPAREATTKIGIGAAAGAVIGGIMGGKKGAVIGGATGAGAGTAVVTTGARNAAILEAGSALTVRLMDSVALLVERQ